MHYLGVDLIGCSALPDRDMSRDVLGQVCGLLGLTALGTPQVEYVSGERGGFSGSLIITESHIAFHAFEVSKDIYFDILSCKPFDVGKLIDWLSDTFRPDEVSRYLIDRTPLP